MLIVKNWTFKTQQKLVVTGKAPADNGFSINIGNDENNIALHFNPRFSDQKDTQTLVLNSKKDGVWGVEEVLQFAYVFHPHLEFKVGFTFTDTEFEIELPNGKHVTFPNRFGVFKFNHIHYEGAGRINSMSIN